MAKRPRESEESSDSEDEEEDAIVLSTPLEMMKMQMQMIHFFQSKGQFELAEKAKEAYEALKAHHQASLKQATITDFFKH